MIPYIISTTYNSKKSKYNIYLISIKNFNLIKSYIKERDIRLAYSDLTICYHPATQSINIAKNRYTNKRIIKIPKDLKSNTEIISYIKSYILTLAPKDIIILNKKQLNFI